MASLQNHAVPLDERALAGLAHYIDTSDATGRLLFNTLGAIAQFETEIRAERQQEGIEKAKAKGVAFGRQRALSDEEAHDLVRKRQAGVLIKDLMSQYGLSKSSTYRYLSTFGAQTG